MKPKSDTLLALYAESSRLMGEIIKASRRIAHRTHVFKHEGIPTSQEKRIQLEFQRRKLEVEYAAVQRGIELEKQRLEPPAGRWYYSDRVLAHLMKCCEDEGHHRLIVMARRLAGLDMNQKRPHNFLTKTLQKSK